MAVKRPSWPSFAASTSAGVIGSAAVARACARAGRVSLPVASAPAASVAPSTSRRENCNLFIGPPSRTRPPADSHSEQSAVARLDLFARLFDPGGVFFHGVDVAEGFAAGLVLDQEVHRAQGAEIDDQLLAFRREAVALEQP